MFGFGCVFDTLLIPQVFSANSSVATIAALCSGCMSMKTRSWPNTSTPLLGHRPHIGTRFLATKHIMTRSSTALPNTPQKWVSHVWPSVGQECFGANAPTVVIKQLAYDSRANGLMRLLGQPREKCRALLHGYPR